MLPALFAYWQRCISGHARCSLVLLSEHWTGFNSRAFCELETPKPRPSRLSVLESYDVSLNTLLRYQRSHCSMLESSIPYLTGLVKSAPVLRRRSYRPPMKSQKSKSLLPQKSPLRHPHFFEYLHNSLTLIGVGIGIGIGIETDSGFSIPIAIPTPTPILHLRVLSSSAGLG